LCNVGNAYRVSVADYTADSIVSVILTCVVVRCKTGNVIQQLQNSTVNHKEHYVCPRYATEKGTFSTHLT